jgi:hypothetical protein
MPETDEATQAEATTEQAAEDSGSESRSSNAAAMSALQKERKARKNLESQLKELLEEQKKREDAELSENARLQKEIESLRKAQERAEREKAVRERADVLRKAAAKAEFADPDEIVALARGLDEIDDIEDAADAERYVKKLAKDKPHLLRKQETLDMSKQVGIEKVLKDGLLEGASDNAKGLLSQVGVIPYDDLAGMTPEALATLKRTQPDVYRRSIEAASGRETSHTVV